LKVPAANKHFQKQEIIVVHLDIQIATKVLVVLQDTPFIAQNRIGVVLSILIVEAMVLSYLVVFQCPFALQKIFVQMEELVVRLQVENFAVHFQMQSVVQMAVVAQLATVVEVQMA